MRISKVHAYIISHLKEQMPMMMGFAKKQKQLIENLPAVFRTVMKVTSPHPVYLSSLIYISTNSSIKLSPVCLVHLVKKYNLAPGDFPDIRDFQDKLSELDFSKFHGLKQKLIDDVETVLANDIPRLMEALPRYTMHAPIYDTPIDSHLSPPRPHFYPPIIVIPLPVRY